MTAEIMFIFLATTLPNTFIFGNSYYHDKTNHLILKFAILTTSN